MLYIPCCIYSWSKLKSKPRHRARSGCGLITALAEKGSSDQQEIRVVKMLFLHVFFRNLKCLFDLHMYLSTLHFFKKRVYELIQPFPPLGTCHLLVTTSMEHATVLCYPLMHGLNYDVRKINNYK